MRFSRSQLTHGPAGPSLGADTDRVFAEFAGAAGSDTPDPEVGTIAEEARS